MATMNKQTGLQGVPKTKQTKKGGRRGSRLDPALTYKRPHIRLVELRHALTPIPSPSAQV